MAKEKATETAEAPVLIGSLTFDQFRAVISAGLPIQQAKELAESGFTYDQLYTLAQESVKANGAQGGLTPAQLKEILDGQRKAMKPENETHPGISVFSHPEGDQKRPKPPLPFQCFYNGYPVHKFPETESWREWELMAQVTPGEFTVVRRDGTPMAVKVDAERDAHGAITKLTISHPILREEKALVPPKIALLYQLVNNEDPWAAFETSMQEYIRSMRPKPVPATV